MEPALWAAKTGLDAQQTQMTVTANNLANVATNGFKKSRAVFDDLLYQNVSQVGAATSQNTVSPTGLQLGTGVRVVSTERSYTQGSLDNTGNSLDLAIQGRGFFQVLQPDGTLAYTRDGSFQVNAQGQVVNSSGYAAAARDHHSDGRTERHDRHRRRRQRAARRASPRRRRSARSSSPTSSIPPGLQTVGGNLAVESASSGAPQTGNPGLTGLGTLVQGSVESSNVNVVEEMVNMIETQRAYEMNSKAVQTTDQMLQYATQNM